MAPQSAAARLVSLDVFRGLTVAAMILVNNPGTYEAMYRPLMHAAWNGWTFTDCVFPFFLFIAGVSMPLAFAKRMEKGESRRSIEWHVVRRTLIIFALGLVVNSFPVFHPSTIRIPGVLQRIALCYLFTSAILLSASVRGQVLWTAGLLASYWAMMKLIPVPELGAGVLDPGRNFAAYVDSLILSGHMWSKYETWDPEGILSTIPAIATMLFGVLAGHWLRSNRSAKEKAAGMLAAGAVLVLAGQIADIWFPINKQIWTSSYSIFMAGLSLVCLSAVYWTVDLKGSKWWTPPFLAFGMNPLFIYVFSELLDNVLRFFWFTAGDGKEYSVRSYIYRVMFQLWANQYNASLMFAIVYVLLMLQIVWLMRSRGWFIRV
jgi:predicted acyltransferase